MNDASDRAEMEGAGVLMGGAGGRSGGEGGSDGNSCVLRLHHHRRMQVQCLHGILLLLSQPCGNLFCL